MRFVDSVDEIKGLHKTTYRLASGEKRVAIYAWKTGPRLNLDPDRSNLLEEYNQAVSDHHMLRRNVPATVRPERRTVSLKLAVDKCFKLARDRAAKNSIPFDLELDWLHLRMHSGGSKCELSGIAFDPFYNNPRRYHFNPYGPSIDRKDSSLGYTPENVRFVLTAVNFGLGEWGESIFRHIAGNVVAQGIINGAQPKLGDE